MQTLTLDQLPTPVLLVWGGTWIETAQLSDSPEKIVSYLKSEDSEWIDLNGNWKLIGKLSELTEEQVKDVVNYFTTDDDFGNEDVFRDYLGKAFYDTALESFHSAIEAEGYFVVNPYSEPIYTTEHSDDCYCLNCEKETKRCADLQDKARQAQSKTLPANTLIFKRV